MSGQVVILGITAALAIPASAVRMIAARRYARRTGETWARASLFVWQEERLVGLPAGDLYKWMIVVWLAGSVIASACAYAVFGTL